MTLPRNLSIGDKTYRRNKTALGNGGNGTVYIASYEGKKYALKVLPKNTREIQRQRFFREMEFLEENCDLSGIPTYYGGVKQRHNLPSYYVMELGDTISSYLKDKPLNVVIRCIANLSKTLNKLKERGISHRDIKPENILIINNSPALCDFGLAHKAGIKRLTAEGDKQIGARMTMAPEMLRDPYHANYHQADSYSLAKTLWMLITKDENSFDGCYNTHSKESLWNYNVEVLGKMEELLSSCTSNNPKSRWNFSQFTTCCLEWLDIFDDEERRANEGWRQLKRRIFPYSQPTTASWEERSDILSILNLVLSHNCRNHSFFPNGGGLDLEAVKETHESGCIELQLSAHNLILKPKSLSFYSPGTGDLAEQDYFLLEADELNFISEHRMKFEEILTELSPLNYTDPNCAYWDDFNGKKLPPESRLVHRWSKGTFGIFLGKSAYNHYGVIVDGKTYDAYSAPHNSFAKEKLFSSFKKMFNQTPKEEYNINYKPSETTRLRSRLLTADQQRIINNFLEKLKSSKVFQKELSRKPSDKFIRASYDHFSWQAGKKEIYTLADTFCTDDLILFNALYYAGLENRPPYGRTLEELQALFFTREEVLETFIQKKLKSIISYIEQGIEMFT